MGIQIGQSRTASFDEISPFSYLSEDGNPVISNLFNQQITYGAADKKGNGNKKERTHSYRLKMPSLIYKTTLCAILICFTSTYICNVIGWRVCSFGAKKSFDMPLRKAISAAMCHIKVLFLFSLSIYIILEI